MRPNLRRPGRGLPPVVHLAGLRFAVVLVSAVLLVPVTGCGGDDRDLGSARTCEELVEVAADVTRGILAQVEDLTFAELDGDGADPFGPLRAPYEPFDRRAVELGCGEAELTRLACSRYASVAEAARGEVAEAFVAAFYSACD